MRIITRITPQLRRPLSLTLTLTLTLTLALAVSLPQAALATDAVPEKNVYFGAVHVHTNYSFDAFTTGTASTPSDAYRWAQGEAIPGGSGGPDMQLKTPLDFYAVSDHAEWMGVFKEMANPRSALSKHPLASRITSDDTNTRLQAFTEVLRDINNGKRDEALINAQLKRSAWSDIVATANAFNKPGEFTTFPAFEWTSNPDMRNLHRVVLFGSSESLPDQVFSANDSKDPEDLWAWMDNARDNGATLLAIPHNGNASDGLMFSLNTFEGMPLSKAYSATRSRNEPLYEISQIKGTSETHPSLSPNDEFADFEIWDYTLSADSRRNTQYRGAYVRQALLDGLSLSAKGKGNPFHYGIIGDSDTHSGATTHEEFNYTGKYAFENNPEHRLFGIPGLPEAQKQQVREFSSGGLAGVWAEENTREAIYAAMLRRETFGTTGPMIRLRFFAGWDFTQGDANARDRAKRGYMKGIPMGGSLSQGKGKAPGFILWAAKDPNSGNLDRVQIIKGWLSADGSQHEQVYNVAWSGKRQINEEGKLPPVGNTVDIKTATYTNSIGQAQLSAYWKDPDFDPQQHAFYYLRVLEIPTPRWSTRDAAKLGVSIPGGLPPTIQERAFSSPIWYEPPASAGGG